MSPRWFPTRASGPRAPSARPAGTRARASRSTWSSPTTVKHVVATTTAKTRRGPASSRSTWHRAARVAFHVFIEKAVDPTPEGRARLAAGIAAKYRLPEAQIAQYLQAGRFRVKSNVDEATARRFAGELQVLGAIV